MVLCLRTDDIVQTGGPVCTHTWYCKWLTNISFWIEISTWLRWKSWNWWWLYRWKSYVLQMSKQTRSFTRSITNESTASKPTWNSEPTIQNFMVHEKTHSSWHQEAWSMLWMCCFTYSIINEWRPRIVSSWIRWLDHFTANLIFGWWCWWR